MCSNLILVCFIVIIRNIALVERRFILIAALDYCYTYLVELYGTLLIFELLMVIIHKICIVKKAGISSKCNTVLRVLEKINS